MGDKLWELYPDSFKKCDKCDGSAQIDCSDCHGKGHTFGPGRRLIAGGGHYDIQRTFGHKECRTCHGSGKRRCYMCDGKGYREVAGT